MASRVSSRFAAAPKPAPSVRTGPERVFAATSSASRRLGKVGAIVLSHGHWDHGGGMLRALDLIRSNGGPGEVPYYAHPACSANAPRSCPTGHSD